MRAGSARRCAPSDDPATKVSVARRLGREEEARAVGEEIEQRCSASGHELNEMAILVRASFQMREFEDRFITLGLPYRVIGGPRFYERLEIRDAMAYLRVIAQPADDLAFERIVNTPKRGLGDATVQHASTTTPARAAFPLLAAARRPRRDRRAEARSRARALRDADRRISTAGASAWRRTPHTELAETMLDESGYTEMWQNDHSAEAPGRLENLKELVRSMEEFENLRGFLEHVSLVMDAEQNAELDAVTIMTLHAAKGLEFDTVFLPGWEEGLFPHQRALDEGGRSGLEEERRLAYVGLTRAKRHCHICFVANRRIHGLWQSTMPSRFVDELPRGPCRGRRSRHPTAAMAADGGRTAQSRFDQAAPFGGHPLLARPAGSARRPTAPRRLEELGHRAPASGRAHRLRRDGFGLRRRARLGARRAPSRASWSPNRSPTPLGLHGRRPGVSHEIRQRQHRLPSTATSSRSISTRPARSACWTGLWKGCEHEAFIIWARRKKYRDLPGQ